jgi:hypothetical protein
VAQGQVLEPALVLVLERALVLAAPAVQVAADKRGQSPCEGRRLSAGARCSELAAT